MAGRGYLDEAVAVDENHIKILRNGRWQKLFRPVNPDRKTSGVSLAESFAEQYALQYGVDVGLIGCADGGTALSQWSVGGLLFDNAVYQARLASRTSTIAGVLWHQGESDCDENCCRQYKARFEEIMRALRQELHLDDVPFLLGGLGDFLGENEKIPSLKNYPMINKQLKCIAQSNPMTGYVSAKGLTANPDNLHFNAASLHEFGHRYFEEFERICDNTKVFAEKTVDEVRTAMELL